MVLCCWRVIGRELGTVVEHPENFVMSDRTMSYIMRPQPCCMNVCDTATQLASIRRCVEHIQDLPSAIGESLLPEVAGDAYHVPNEVGVQ